MKLAAVRGRGNRYYEVDAESLVQTGARRQNDPDACPMQIRSIGLGLRSLAGNRSSLIKDTDTLLSKLNLLVSKFEEPVICKPPFVL